METPGSFATIIRFALPGSIHATLSKGCHLLIKEGAALVETVQDVLQGLGMATHPHASDPYFLYAASNAGSLAALLTYPVVIEPRLALGAQSRWWATGYALLVVLMAALALVTWRHRRSAIPLTLPSPLEGERGSGAEPE